MKSQLSALCGLILACASVGVGHAQMGGATASVTTFVERERVAPGSTVRAALQVTLPEGFHVQSNRPRDPSLIPTELTFAAPDGVTIEEIVFPSPVDLKQIGLDQPLAVFERVFTVGVQFDIDSTIPTGSIEVPGRLRYQACNETTCFAPRTAETSWRLLVAADGAIAPAQQTEIFDRIAFGTGQAPGAAPLAAADPRGPAILGQPERVDVQTSLDDFTVQASTGGYLGVADFLTFVRNAETGVKEPGWFEGRGPLAILLLVLVGGLALNLTPCVLPMIPINLAIIGAGSQAGSRARGFMLGGAYGAAMAFVYGLLGLVVILTAGTFGTINASPWFNLGIALLFVVLGLAMFDLITIDFSRFSSGVTVGGAARGSLIVAFGMGAIAALLAGACVAPVVIQVVLFASDLYARGTTIALALPFFLGIGMAIPWPFAGAGMAALPKPGAWMVRVKQALGVVILATAAYYGQQAFGLFANRWVDPTAVASSVQEKLKEGWYASLGAGLDEAKREGKPVLVDLWATWCKNCLVMDNTTLRDPGVVATLERYVKIKFQAEDPDNEPAKSIMQRFDAVGLPAYVILTPRSDR
ncbi:MAG TPA: cytochrome c biogenesis protein CcdA [Vicinamibacterales bacterium]|nr:cytochrome c biogenesis protein CcdA [Vicinamibacterales bacterium]